MNGNVVLLSLLFALPTSIGQGVKVSLELKSESVVSDVVTLKAEVSTDSSITKVEFSVDDQLRAALTKPPWEFKWDTIDESEGPHTVIANAYDAAGKAGRVRVKVEVDNGLTKGVKFHSELAFQKLAAGERDGAYYEGRKAYRINMGDLDAIRAMAAGIGARGELARAIDLLEKPVVMNNQTYGDPKLFPLIDPLALQLRGAFRMQRASSLTDAAQLLAELTTVYELGSRYFVVVSQEVAKSYPPENISEDACIARGDLLFAQREFEKALAAYSQCSNQSQSLILRGNLVRIALGRAREVELALSSTVSVGRALAAETAVYALALSKLKRFDQARSLTDPLSARSFANRLVCAFASLALRDNRRSFDHISQCALLNPIFEVQAVAASLFTETGDLARGTASLVEALKLNPTNLDLFAMRGHQLGGLAPADNAKLAGPYYDFVMRRNPGHVGAKIGRALVCVEERRFTTAENLLNDLLRTDPKLADAHMVKAALHRARREFDLEATEAETAKKLEPDLFPEGKTPSAKMLWVRIAAYRRAPVFTPAILAMDLK